MDCKSRLKELRGRYKACANSINAAKGEIDDLSDAIQEKKVSWVQEAWHGFVGRKRARV